METIFHWLAGALATILEKYADPQLQSRLDAYNAKVKELEAEEKVVLAEIEAGQKRIADLDKLRLANEAKTREIEGDITKANEELETKNTAVLASPDDDIERKLPGSN